MPATAVFAISWDLPTSATTTSAMLLLAAGFRSKPSQKRERSKLIGAARPTGGRRQRHRCYTSCLRGFAASTPCISTLSIHLRRSCTRSADAKAFGILMHRVFRRNGDSRFTKSEEHTLKALLRQPSYGVASIDDLLRVGAGRCGFSHSN